MWDVRIFETRTGAPALSVPVSSCSWESGKTGRGRGTHQVPLANSGLTRDVVQEIFTGNKYTIAQIWRPTGFVAYAGVIQRPGGWSASKRVLTVESAELRVAYMNSRMLFGVPEYDPTGTVLTVTSKSHSGAARAVIGQAIRVTSSGSIWALPIDLPADGSGSFNATWKFSDRLKWEDHLTQIEDDGCEIDFRPYVDSGGWLRWETRVDTKIVTGAVSDLAVNAPGTRVVDLNVDIDTTEQMTGTLGFGKGTLWAAAGEGAPNFSVRDNMVNFPDIDDFDRLQAAVNHTYYDIRKFPTEQWSIDLHIWPDGPALAQPGRPVNVWTYGDPFITDGKHAKQVVSVRGDMGFQVTAGVQDA